MKAWLCFYDYETATSLMYQWIHIKSSESTSNPKERWAARTRQEYLKQGRYMLILFFLKSTHIVAHAVSWSCGQRLILSSSQSRSHTSQVLHYPNSLIRTDCCSLSPEMETLLHRRKRKRDRQTDWKTGLRKSRSARCYHCWGERWQFYTQYFI